MERPRTNPIVHVLPSLTDVAFLLPLILIFTVMGDAKALLRDADTGWHIRTGEWILANHQVPHRDIFSYTKPGQPWFAWEWLSDVIFAWLHQHWGLAGVVALGMLLLCLTSALLFRLTKRHCSNPLIAIGFTYLAIAASTIHWHARPHLFTLLLVVVVLHILDRVQDGRMRLLWLLPPMIAVWTNLHGGFFVAIFIIGCFAGGEFIAWLVDADQQAGGRALRKAWTYAMAASACLAASFLNPYGYHLHLFIFEYLRAPFLDMIQEFMGVNFRAVGVWKFEFLLFSAVALIGWTVVRRRYTQALLTAAWAHLALTSARNVPIFGLIAAPFAAQACDELFDVIATSNLAFRVRRFFAGFADAGSDIRELDNAWRVPLVSVGVFILVTFAMTRPGPAPKFVAAFDGDKFPVSAVPVLKQHGPARIFTRDQWGDYLIYRFYPNVRVYMDGRSDFYGNDFMNEYGKLLNATDGWDKTLERYGVDTVLLSVNESLATVLKLSPQWHVVYDDHKAIVFEKVSPGSGAQVPSAQTARVDGDHLITDSQYRDPTVTVGVNRDRQITRKQL